MRILNQQEVQTLLDLDQLIAALEPAMADLSAGHASMPQRIVTFSQQAEGLLGAMPAGLRQPEVLSTKLVTVFPQNEQLDLPTHQAVILLFDADNGAPLAMLDGTHITAARTAAGSALATKLLARAEAGVLAIVGTGVQARAHARAIPRVRPIRELRIWGRNEQKAAALAREMGSELSIPTHTCGSFQQLAAGADVICATTDAPEPVVFGQWLEPGVHVNSVGLNVNGRELDDAVVTRSAIFVESREAALTGSAGGANDLTWPINAGTIAETDILAEVGELVLGKHQGRTSEEQITLYKSVGVAVQDAVAASLVLRAAQEAGVGTLVEL